MNSPLKAKVLVIDPTKREIYQSEIHHDPKKGLSDIYKIIGDLSELAMVYEHDYINHDHLLVSETGRESAGVKSFSVSLNPIKEHWSPREDRESSYDDVELNTVFGVAVLVGEKMK